MGDYNDILKLDSYNIGVLAYKMFTGIFPLENKNNLKEIKTFNFNDLKKSLEDMSYRNNEAFQRLSFLAQYFITSNIQLYLN